MENHITCFNQVRDGRTCNGTTGGPSLPESICRYDERVQVDPTTSPPNDWICSLLIESATDGKYFGSGFVIHTILMA